MLKQSNFLIIQNTMRELGYFVYTRDQFNLSRAQIGPEFRSIIFKETFIIKSNPQTES